MAPDYYQRELVTAVSHAISTVGNEKKDPNVGFCKLTTGVYRPSCTKFVGTLCGGSGSFRPSPLRSVAAYCSPTSNMR